MRLSQALDAFLVQLRADGRSPHTIDQYRRHIGLLDRWLAQARRRRELRAITPDVLARFLTDDVATRRRDGSPKMATSTNTLRTSVRAFFAFTHAAGHVRNNPARLIRRARCATAPPRTLSEPDCQRLMETLAAGEGPLADRDHMLFALMLQTGARLSSACAIERDDIDFGQREIRLRVTKGDRPAVILFGRELATHLRRYCKGRGRGPLFAGQRNRYLGTRHVRARLALWLERAGIEGAISPHGLRHTFAVNVYRKTGDLLVVREALTHASVASSAIYARLDRTALRAALGA